MFPTIATILDEDVLEPPRSPGGLLTMTFDELGERVAGGKGRVLGDVRFPDPGGPWGGLVRLSGKSGKNVFALA